ncbi:unannotated protein [freshwater metagenome]|uniref:Unannotated protein n=1 Tax=freshwater metagenome TaxID=449393 RepID=A0A6J7A8L6_9ZZZZ
MDHLHDPGEHRRFGRTHEAEVLEQRGHVVLRSEEHRAAAGEAGEHLRTTHEVVQWREADANQRDRGLRQGRDLGASRALEDDRALRRAGTARRVQQHQHPLVVAHGRCRRLPWLISTEGHQIVEQDKLRGIVHAGKYGLGCGEFVPIVGDALVVVEHDDAADRGVRLRHARGDDEVGDSGRDGSRCGVGKDAVEVGPTEGGLQRDVHCVGEAAREVDGDEVDPAEAEDAHEVVRGHAMQRVPIPGAHQGAHPPVEFAVGDGGEGGHVPPLVAFGDGVAHHLVVALTEGRSLGIASEGSGDDLLDRESRIHDRLEHIGVRQQLLQLLVVFGDVVHALRVAGEFGGSDEHGLGELLCRRWWAVARRRESDVTRLLRSSGRR